MGQEAVVTLLIVALSFACLDVGECMLSHQDRVRGDVAQSMESQQKEAKKVPTWAVICVLLFFFLLMVGIGWCVYRKCKKAKLEVEKEAERIRQKSAKMAVKQKEDEEAGQEVV